MYVHCPRCNPQEVFKIPDLTSEQKAQMLLAKKKSPIYLVKLLCDDFQLAHGEAKFISMHLILKHGSCHRCDTTIGNEEIVHCQKCQSLNLNW